MQKPQEETRRTATFESVPCQGGKQNHIREELTTCQPTARSE